MVVAFIVTLVQRSTWHPQHCSVGIVGFIEVEGFL